MTAHHECQGSDEEDLDASVNGLHFDFSAWDSFRKSISTMNRRSSSTLLVGFGEAIDSDDESENEENDTIEPAANTSKCIDENGDDDDNTESTASEKDCEEDNASSKIDSDEEEGCDEKCTFELTEEEKHDNARWRMRFTDSSVFGWEYIPKIWERNEMETIVKFLELKPPNILAQVCFIRRNVGI